MWFREVTKTTGPVTVSVTVVFQYFSWALVTVQCTVMLCPLRQSLGGQPLNWGLFNDSANKEIMIWLRSNYMVTSKYIKQTDCFTNNGGFPSYNRCLG